MATEYWLVKPSKKEIYYLGKHIRTFNGISEKKAKFIDYECYSDFLMDLFEENYFEFDTEMTLGELFDLAHDIYEWCDAEVYLSNDCCDDIEWGEWDETGSIFSKRVSGSSSEELSE